MTEAFTPLFGGHVASDDQINIDGQIDAVFYAIDALHDEWHSGIDVALPKYRQELYADRDRELGTLRAAVATLTRLRARRDAILAPALRDATDAALDAEAAR